MLKPIAFASTPGEYSGQRIVNGFVRPAGGVSQGVVIGASGVLPLVTLSAGNPVRAMVDHGGVLHAICGGKLWSVSGGVATELATVADGVSYMASSGTELGIVADETYYLWSGGALTTPTTGQVTTPREIAHLRGYFIVGGADVDRGDTFAVSNLNDGATFDGLDFATAESAPDDITGIVADHSQLWFFGTRTVDVWYPSAGDLPFAPNIGAFLQQGCANGRTIAHLDNSLFWVSPENTVLRSAGGSPEVISTPEIEEALAASTVEGGLAFFDKGHLVYAIQRTDDTALCYDVRTQQWHERAQGALARDQWSAVVSVTSGTVQYLGTASGKIATLDPDTYTDDGAVMAFEVTTQPVSNGGRPFSVARVYAQFAGGKVGLSYAPKVLLQTSKDGKNWTEGRFRDLAAKGEYMNAVQWNGMGSFRDAAWMRLRITDPVQRDCHGVAYE